MPERTEFSQDQIYAYHKYKMRYSVEHPGQPLKTLQEYVEWLEEMEKKISAERNKAQQ